MKKFSDLQIKTLRTILADGRKTKLLSFLGLSHLSREKDMEVLQMDFAAGAPISRYDELIATLRKAAENVEATAEELWTQPKFSSSTPPLVLLEEGHKLFPFNKPLSKALLAEEKAYFARIRKQFGLKGALFDLHETTTLNRMKKPPQGTLATWLAKHRSSSNMLPKNLEETENSRYQSLHAFIHALEAEGTQAEILVCHPRTLVDLSLLIAQKTRRFISLQSLCPHLKMIIFRNQSIGVYAKEIAYFTQGLTLTFLEMHQLPTGFCAFQETASVAPEENGVSAPGILTVPLNLPVFLGFIPEEEILSGGHFHKNHKRLHAGQLEVGKNYLLINTNNAGLMAYNTEKIYKIHNLSPLQVSFQRPMNKLNGFGENIPENVLSPLLAEINEALTPHGFFIRDYMIADHVHNRRALLVLESSRLLAEVGDPICRAITNRIHTELISRLDSYRRTFQNAAVFPPEIVFVPMGTFASMPDNFPRQHMDHTPDARLAAAVVESAFETKRFLAGVSGH